jgi:small-conductance mechanosensitive channel
LQNLSTIGVYIIAGLSALSILGIDLTAFAVLGGAIGVGIGLGLQKISSNFISGLILLSERTIQVNDLIEIEGSPISGLVKHTGARYTLIETLDNREVLVPNDDLITNRVINSTHTNSRGLIRIDIGVAYGSDLEKVREIITACTCGHPNILKDPAPACFLMGFGPSAVDFTIFGHIEDVRERKLGTKSEILFDIWKRFKAEGIEIALPQLQVHVVKDKEDAAA